MKQNKTKVVLLQSRYLYANFNYISYFHYFKGNGNKNYPNELDKKLDDIWESEDTPIYETRNKKYTILSDFHLGNGTAVDKFKENEEVALRLLDYHYINGYSLILLGDIEELWRFSLGEIIGRYNNTVYKSLRRFGNDRVFRIFGNHDIDWRNSDPIRIYNNETQLANEAIKLNDINGNAKILLIHGHQGTKDADKYSWFSRKFIRGYRYFEPLVSLKESPAAPRSPIFKSIEQSRYNWAKNKKVILICGHTHRAVFCSLSKIDQLIKEIEQIEFRLNHTFSSDERKKLLLELGIKKDEKIREQLAGREFYSLGDNPSPCYFNTGCALYKDGITLIEIVDNIIKLVKWHRHIKGEVYDIYELAKIDECLKII